MSLLDRATENARYSINEFIGDGERITWEISFAGGYIKREHVKAITTDLDGNTNEVSLDWDGDSTVKISPPVPYGYGLTIFRDTPKDKPTADFQDGAVINERNLDDNAKQAVFIAAEALDRGEGALAELAPRAILVPVGEIAPSFPPRARMKGKLVGVDLNGKIIPVGWDGFNATINAGMVEFDGGSLSDKLRDAISKIALSTEELERQALAITDQGDALTAQATSTQKLDEKLAQLKSDHEALTAVVDALEGLEGYEGLATVIQEEKSQRITEDNALAAKIALIGATNGDGTAFILSLDNIRVTPTETLAERLEYLDAVDDEAAALIQDERTARIAGDSAEATARQQLGTSFGQQLASAIATEQQARADADSAEATARTQLAATLRGEADSKISAAINSEQQARVNGDLAEAQARQQLAATLRTETDNKVTAAVQSSQQAWAAADQAEAQAREQLGTTLNGTISAQVQAERDARVGADNAFASTLSLIGAVTNGGSAFQLDTSKVLVQPGVALGTRLSGFDVAISNARASAVEEAVAQVNGSLGSLASRTTSLEAGFAVEAGWLNPNPSFKVWSNPSNPPDTWSWWDASAGIARAGGVNGRPFAAQFNAPANQNAGIMQSLNAAFGAFVIEFTGRATDWQGAGVLAQFCGPGAGDPVYESAFLNAAAIPDSSGYTSADGGGGVYTRTFSAFYKTGINGNIRRVQLYAMANWDGYGERRAKTIAFDRVSIRPANAAEIAAQRADANANDAIARVGSLEYATSNPNGAVAKRLSDVEAKAGDAQSKAGIAQQASVDATTKLANARVELIASTPGGRATVTLRSDSNGGAGINLGGDVQIDGNLTVDGSINGQQKLAPNSISNSVFLSQGAKNVSVSGQPGTAATVTTDPVYFGATGGVVRLDYKVATSVSAAAAGANWQLSITVRGTDGSVYGAFTFRSTGVGSTWYNGETGWTLDTRGINGTLGYYFECQLVTSTYPSTTISASIAPTYCIQEFKR